MIKNRLSLHGASADAAALIVVKLMTMTVSLVVTRLLSQCLSVYDYGTYSQVLLVSSTVASLTIFGMMDGMNYFFCSEHDEWKRESYVAAIYVLQCILSILAGIAVFLLRNTICDYLGNRSAANLMFFAAAMPLFQNMVSITQVLIVSIGRARILAVRNLIVSILKFLVVLFVIHMGKTIGWILMASMVIDIVQLIWLIWILDHNSCKINIRAADFRLFPDICRYCAPMAVFTMLNALTRDTDKYIISIFTDTEKLAIYSNASKVLPFDIIMASFTTVLLPVITRSIADKDYNRAVTVYKRFLEIAYSTTTILAVGALVSAPELMVLLYSRKYLAGIGIFVVYILVDIIRFTNITLILSAAGKTALLMKISILTVITNIFLSIGLFRLMGWLGPAIATLIIMFAAGMFILRSGAASLEVRLRDFFDIPYLMRFMGSIIAVIFPALLLRRWMVGKGIHYVIILICVSCFYMLTVLLINRRRIICDINAIGRIPR